MKRKKSVKHKWTRTDGFLGGVAVVGGIIIGFMLSKQPLPIEGEFTKYTLLWQLDATFGFNTAVVQKIAPLEQFDKIAVYSGAGGEENILTLSTGKPLENRTFIEPFFMPNEKTSIFGKYVAYPENTSGSVILNIYKNNTLLQSVTLASLGWVGGGNFYSAVSQDGKYIMFGSLNDNKIALFKGS